MQGRGCFDNVMSLIVCNFKATKNFLKKESVQTFGVLLLEIGVGKRNRS